MTKASKTPKKSPRLAKRKRATNRPFPYEQVAKMWAQEKTIPEIAKARQSNRSSWQVQKAIERAGTSDYQTLSATRLIPEEARNYVPAVLRAITLLQGGKRVQAGGPEFVAVFCVPCQRPSAQRG